MDDVVMTEGDYRVTFMEHPDPQSPRWEDVTVGTMVCSRRRYDLGDEHTGVAGQAYDWLKAEGLRAMLTWLSEAHGVTVALPLYLYDRSGLTMRAGANLYGPWAAPTLDWDTSMVGVIFATARELEGAGILGDPEEILRAEVAEYAAYLEGDMYVLQLEQRAWDKATITRTMPGGETVTWTEDIERWLPYPDSTISVTGYGNIAETAADMLAEFTSSEGAP